MNQLLGLFNLLSDETRLRTVVLLSQEQLCVCELSGILQIPQPKVSKALARLRALQRVEDERKDKFIYYRLKPVDPVLQGILADILAQGDRYPQIQQDIAGIRDKDRYSSQTPIDASILT